MHDPYIRDEPEIHPVQAIQKPKPKQRQCVAFQVPIEFVPVIAQIIDILTRKV